MDLWPILAAEVERESGKKFVALRRQPSAVANEIHSLEHQGLNRRLDVGLGVLICNLPGIGRELLARARAKVDPVRAVA